MADVTQEILALVFAGLILFAAIPIGTVLHRRETRRQLLLWAGRNDFTIKNIRIPWFPIGLPFKRRIFDGWTGVARVEGLDSERNAFQGDIQIIHMFKGSRDEWIESNLQ